MTNGKLVLKTTLAAAALSLGLVSSPVPAQAAGGDAFMRVDGIEGEATERNHAKWSNIASFSWGATNSGGLAMGGGGGAGKVQFNQVMVTKTIDKATPKLAQVLAEGRHLAKVEFDFTRGGRAEFAYLKVTLMDVTVSTETIAVASAADPGVEHVGFNFAKVEIEYKEQKADGSAGPPVKFGWDVKQNVKI